MNNELLNLCHLDDSKCACKGSGWVYTNSWHHCLIHYEGNLHPESKDLIVGDIEKLYEAERLSVLRFKIKRSRDKVLELEKEINNQNFLITKYELELVNRTPTIQMRAVKIDMLEDSNGDVIPIDSIK